ncbi:hypothetical protein PC116_g6477 [Phytophthora cactorum]|nr:hypothetical protein PC114_g8359 [Phytophthora cactorum]KAG3091247.1 hypothetical protein PC122_g7079 [Phytophthora cactorum]KAG3193983.1 hypothetical protein PC128_g9770 [Phytophthora cactorum]KAG4058242.1 hypothetical protein PC123_g6781 [Phytophthora cactorum]KAG4245721.1 hypothetical protein PC116_g6477 [Phytophthora cactorum]
MSDRWVQLITSTRSAYPSIHAHYDLLPRVNVVGEYDLQDSTTPEQEADFTSYTRLPVLPMKFRAVRWHRHRLLFVRRGLLMYSSPGAMVNFEF